MQAKAYSTLTGPPELIKSWIRQIEATKSGELGAGLVALEVATLASLPEKIRNSTVAGGADMRLRIPHNITHVTLHPTGDAKPLLPGDSPVARLRGLQSWGASDRNWWDVPYHFLLGLDGDIYEGRDYHFMGETNTAYDPGGHFLISAAIPRGRNVQANGRRTIAQNEIIRQKKWTGHVHNSGQKLILNHCGISAISFRRNDLSQPQRSGLSNALGCKSLRTFVCCPVW